MFMETQLSLQAFWDAVERRLTACSAEELRAIVRALARATPPPQRQAFLDALLPVVVTAAVVPQEPTSETLLTDIDTLMDALQEALDRADDWDWDEYDEEDSLGPYEAFVEPLTVLFDRAAAACDAGIAALARTAYQKLFEALSREDDYGRG